MSKHFLRFSIPVLFIIIIGSAANVFAQTTAWRYVRTIQEGAKVYIGSEIETLANNHLIVWDKRLTTDGSYAVSRVEWDCRNARRQTLEMTMYREDQSVLGSIKRKFDWQSIVTGSVAEVMFRQICFERPAPQFVEIIVIKANLLSLPDKDAKVLRTAGKGSKFILIVETGTGGWYNIVDEKTQQDYWVEKNAIKIVENKK